MKTFENYNFSWRQLRIAKLSFLFIGIAIGSHWGEVLSSYSLVFAIAGIALVVYGILVFLSQNKEKISEERETRKGL